MAEKILVARESRVTLFLGMVGLLGFWGILVWGGFDPPKRWVGFENLLFLLSLIPAAGVAAALYRQIVDRGHCVWIAEGKLHMGWGRSAPLASIRDIRLQTQHIVVPYIFNKFITTIAVTLEDGRVIESNGVDSFIEVLPNALERLRAAAGLPEDASAGTPRQA